MARASRRKSHSRRKSGRYAAKAGSVRKRRRHAASPAVANPRKKKRKAGKRRSLKRKRPGHHKHTVKGHLRKVRGRKRRVRVKRHRSHEEAVRANPRRGRGKKRKGVKGRRRHAVKQHLRRVGRGPARRRVRVKRHMSWEEKARRARRRAKRAREEMAAMAAKPRRRKRRRARAREEVVVANSRRKRRSPKRRRVHKRRRAARETVLANPRKKRAKRRTRKHARRNPRMRAVVPAVVRRRTKRGGGKARPASLKLEIITKSSRRSASKRRTYKKKRKSSKKRKSPRRTPTSHRLPPASELLLGNPIGSFGMQEYALSNPLDKKELALAAVFGGAGFIFADIIDRYVAVKYSTLSAGPNNPTQQQIVEGPPGIKRIGAQALTAVVVSLPAYFSHRPMLRAASQGAALGVVIHAASQLIKSYLLGKALASNATIQQLYPDTLSANAAVATAQAASGSTGTLAGFFGLGRKPAAAPYGLGYRDVGPRAGVGQLTAAGPAVGAVAPSSAVIPGTTPSYTGNGGGNCAQPCAPGGETLAYNTLANVMPVASGETMTATIQSAYNAARDEVCGVAGVTNGAVVKTKAHLTFPE